MSGLVKEIERQLGYDMLEEGNMGAYDVLEIVKNFKQPQLNDNQKIVLDILKDIQNKWPHFHPSTTIVMMVEMQNEFYEELSKDQELEVLAAFARWGLEQEE